MRSRLGECGAPTLRDNLGQVRHHFVVDLWYCYLPISDNALLSQELNATRNTSKNVSRSRKQSAELTRYGSDFIFVLTLNSFFCHVQIEQCETKNIEFCETEAVRKCVPKVERQCRTEDLEECWEEDEQDCK